MLSTIRRQLFERINSESQLKAQLAELQTQHAQLVQQHAETTLQSSQQASQLASLYQRIDDNHQQILVQEKVLTSLRADKLCWEQQEKEFDRLKADKVFWQQQEKEYDNHIATLKSTIAAKSLNESYLQQQLLASKEINLKLKLQLKESEENVSKQNTRYAELHAAYTNLHNNWQSQPATLTFLNSQIASLKQQLDIANFANQNGDAQLAMVQSELEETKEQLDIVTTQRDEQKAAAQNELEKSERQRQSMIDVLEKGLEQTTQMIQKVGEWEKKRTRRRADDSHNESKRHDNQLPPMQKKESVEVDKRNEKKMNVDRKQNGATMQQHCPDDSHMPSNKRKRGALTYHSKDRQNSTSYSVDADAETISSSTNGAARLRNPPNARIH